MLTSIVLVFAAAPKASALEIGIMSADNSWESEAGWNAIAHSGVKIVRAGVSANDYYNPERWAKVKAMFRYSAERDITLIPYLYGRPDGSQRFPEPGEWEPPGNQWETFVYGVVQYFGYNGSFWTESGHPANYKPVTAWEVWNEPNLIENNPYLYDEKGKPYQQIQPQNYAKFLYRTASAIQEAQKLKTPGSGTQVLFGGLYSGGGMSVGEFLKKAEETKGINVGSAFNGLSLHPYSFQGGTWGVEQYVSDARTQLTNDFGNKSLWITELGWNVPAPPGSGEKWDDANHPAVSESQQAEYLTSSFNWIKSVAGTKNIPVAIWYDYRDSGGCQAWECHAGLRAAGENGAYRSAWTRFQEQTGATEWPDYNPYSWHTENLHGVATSDPEITTSGPYHLEVFERGSDGALWRTGTSGYIWSGWSSLGSQIVGGPGGVFWNGNRTDVVARGTDKTLTQWWNLGSGWNCCANLGRNTESDSDLSSWGPNRLDVFSRGSDNALWHRYWNGTVWSNWESLGGKLISGPSAVSWGPNRIDVVALAPDQTLETWYYDGSWHTGPNLGGVNTSDPDIASTALGHLVVAVRGSDYALWLKQYDVSGGWTGWEKLGGSLSSGPSAVGWGKNYRLDIVAQANDHTLTHWWWGPSGP